VSLSRLINVSMEDYAVRSWAADYQLIPQAAISTLSTPDQAIQALRLDVERLVGGDNGAQARAGARAEQHRRFGVSWRRSGRPGERLPGARCQSRSPGW